MGEAKTRHALPIEGFPFAARTCNVYKTDKRYLAHATRTVWIARYLGLTIHIGVVVARFDKEVTNAKEIAVKHNGTLLAKMHSTYLATKPSACKTEVVLTATTQNKHFRKNGVVIGLHIYTTFI